MSRSIAVHSFKGGTGKSTITANLAAALALEGKHVGVIDMDLEGPGLHVLFDINPEEVESTLNDVLLDAAKPEQAMLRLTEKLGLKSGEIYFIPAAVKVADILKTLRTGFELESFSNILSRVQDDFKLDYLLVDTHPGLENDTLLAMGVCDELLMVSRIDQQDVFGTGVMLIVARALEKPIGLVLNMIPPQVKDADASKVAAKLAERFKVDVMEWVPFCEDIIGSLSKSVFVLAMPRHSVAERFRDLAGKIGKLN